MLLEALTVISPYHFSQMAVSINRNTTDRYQAHNNYALIVNNLTEYFKIKHGFYTQGISTYQCNVIISREKVFHSLMAHEKRLVSMRSGLGSSRAHQSLSLHSLKDIMETILGVSLNSEHSEIRMRNFAEDVQGDVQEALMAIGRDVLVRVGKLRSDRADELEEQKHRRRLEAQKLAKGQRHRSSASPTAKKNQSSTMIVAYNNPYVAKRSPSRQKNALKKIEEAQPSREDHQEAEEFAERFRGIVERDNIDVRAIFASHDVDQNMAVTPGEFRMLCSSINVGLDDR